MTGSELSTGIEHMTGLGTERSREVRLDYMACRIGETVSHTVRHEVSVKYTLYISICR